jgi:hypothetical protein
MIHKLSQREKRTIKIGAVCAVVILVMMFGTRWFERWDQAKTSLSQMKAKLDLVDVDKAERAGLMSIVPTFEMPQSEEKQKFLFRDKFNEQVKKAGIKSEPLQILPVGRPEQSGYKLLRLKFTGKGKFGQALDLLANLKENPYLVGIEEMRIQCDPKKREEVELELTVSTFVK